MNRTLTSRIAIMAWLVASLLLVFNLDAKAQTDGWVTMSNYTSCEVTVCLANGGPCITLFPGSVIRVTVPCATTTVTYMSCGVLRKISIGNCHTAVNVGDCCADVCFDPGFIACTSFLTFNATTRRCFCLSGLE